MAEMAPSPEAIARLDDARQRFDQGDKSAVLEAMFISAAFNIKPPDWTQKAFKNSYYEARVLEMHKSWDDIFGLPMPKGAHVGKKLETLQKQWSLHTFVEIARENDGAKLGDELFEAAGKAFGMSKTKANELYYTVENLFRENR